MSAIRRLARMYWLLLLQTRGNLKYVHFVMSVRAVEVFSPPKWTRERLNSVSCFIC